MEATISPASNWAKQKQLKLPSGEVVTLRAKPPNQTQLLVNSGLDIGRITELKEADEAIATSEEIQALADLTAVLIEYMVVSPKIRRGADPAQIEATGVVPYELLADADAQAIMAAIYEVDEEVRADAETFRGDEPGAGSGDNSGHMAVPSEPVVRA